MINVESEISNLRFKAEIPVAEKSERDAATENEEILQHVLSIVAVAVGARHSNWIIKRAQINSIGVCNGK